MSRGRAGGLGEAIAFAARDWRTVAVLLWANWLVAGLMVAPMLSTVLAVYGHAPRAVGQPVLLQLRLGLTPLVARGALSILAPLLLLAVLQTALAGGVAWRAGAGGAFHLGVFLGQCGRLAGRNARLYLWLLLLLLVVAVVPGGLAVAMHALGLPTVFTASADTWLFGRPLGAWSLLHLGVVALALAVWRLAVDVGRVQLFLADARATRQVAWAAVRLVLGAPVAVAAYAVLGALATLAVLLAMRVHAMLPEGKAALALLALGVGQVVLWIRLTFQVAGTRFAATLLARETPPVPAAELQESNIGEIPAVEPPAG